MIMRFPANILSFKLNPRIEMLGEQRINSYLTFSWNNQGADKYCLSGKKISMT